MKRLISLIFAASILAGCGGGNDAAARQHAAQAWANHLHRLAWQRAHPKEWAAKQARARAENLRKAELAQQRRAAAAAHAAAAARYAAEHTPCKEFGRGLESINGVGNIVASYNCTQVGSDGVLIHVTVRDEAWQSFDYDERLQLAKSLWAGCVKYAHPEQADSCHIKLVGEAGEDLGGSNDFAGSIIDVSKD